jgi:hypothetical protein
LDSIVTGFLSGPQVLGFSRGTRSNQTLCKANQANEEVVTVYRMVLSYRGVLSWFRRSVVASSRS